MNHDNSSAASSAQATPLDAAAIARLRELDPGGRLGVLRRVLTAFESSLARMLAQLAAEREAGNEAVVSGIAHTLKSSSASVGALALAAACAEVENRLRAGPGLAASLRADVSSLLDEGSAALAAVRSMLQD
jgi:hypothetical protein